MAVVKMHKASDGSLHESFDAFAKHEEKLKIGEICKSVIFVTAGFELDDRDNEVLHVDNIAVFVAANADALRNILANSNVSKRGRKSVK